MTLSTAEIEEVVEDLAPRLVGGTVHRITRPAKRAFILHIRNDEKRFWLNIVANPQFSRLHLLTHRPDDTGCEGGFCNVLRQHLTGQPVSTLRQVEGDRVVILDVTVRDALLKPSEISLIAELTGTGANLILVDEDRIVLGAMRTEDSDRRTIQPGRPYEPLPPPPHVPEKARDNRFAGTRDPDDPLALHREIEQLYEELESGSRLDERRKALGRRIQAKMNRLRGRMEGLQKDLNKARQADELKRDGELLKIALPRIEQGQTEVTVRDHFEPDAPEREIELDPALSPQQNIQQYFEEYKRRRDSREHVEQRIRATEEHIKALKRAASRLEDCEKVEDIDKLKDTLLEGNLLPPEGTPESKQTEDDKSAPRQFVSADGIEILVARNSRQNHELTFSISRGNDYWMHLLGWPGPHVIIRKPRDSGVPRRTLIDAAHLAIYYSKIRGTDYAEVIYTQRKYVNPIKGAGPGKVRYSHEQSMAVRVDNNRIKRLLRSRQ
ncbi:MAG: Rqc2 family fibronectin-binding protein [Planctomycetota bacterium]